MESHRGRDRDGEGDGGTRVVEATEGRGDFVCDQRKLKGFSRGLEGQAPLSELGSRP